MSQGNITEPNKMLDFMLAGRALFTIRGKTRHYTYKVKRAPDDGQQTTPLRWWVRLLAGPDNTDQDAYKYIGQVIVYNGRHPRFELTGASQLPLTSPAVAGFKWMLDSITLENEDRLAQFEFWHEGRCCACGRLLTDPESIESGIGPVCGGRQ